MRSQDHAHRELQVQAFAKKLPNAKQFNVMCICHEANDKGSKVMNTCAHVFHLKCIISYWSFNMVYQDFECPICNISSREAIKVVHIAGR